MHRFSHSLEKTENSVQRERDRETEKDLDTQDVQKVMVRPIRRTTDEKNYRNSAKKVKK